MLLALLALTIGYLLGRHAPPTTPLPDIVNVDDLPAIRTRESKPRRDLPVARAVPRKAIATAPLPPAGTPLAEIYDDLAARARAGDSAAAMRLLYDLQRCSGRKLQTSLLSIFANLRNTGAIDPGGTANFDAETSKTLDRLTELDTFCAKITPDQIDARGEWLRTGALDGDAEAMVCYAAAPNDFGPKFLSDAWFDWTQRWQDEAPQFAAQAYAAGQADVIDLLLDAYGDTEPVPGMRYTNYQFGQLIAPDPVLEYAYALLYERVVPANSLRNAHSRVVASQAPLTPEQITWAQAFADDIWPRFMAQAGERSSGKACREGLYERSPYR